MKTLSLFCIAALVSPMLHAQENEPVVATVNYEFIHVFDLNKPQNPVKQEMILRLGKASSRYTVYSGESVKKASETPVAAAPVQVVVGRPMAVVTSPGRPNGEIFQYLTDRKLVTTSSLGRADYRIDAPLPAFQWKINPDKMKIGGYNCQKATGKYGGRTWYAWFCADLPFQSGPWKLNGLPGLILQAADSTGDVQFLFKEISKDPNPEQIASRLTRLVTVSQEAFDRVKTVFQENPAATMQSQLPPGASPVSPAYVDENGKYTIGAGAEELIRKKQKETRFNPLELK